MSKYGGFSGPYFPAFGPEKTPYLDTYKRSGEKKEIIQSAAFTYASGLN